MGSGSTSVQQPSAPQAPTAGQSIEEFLQFAPQLFELQQQQAPLEAQQQLEMLQQFGGQFGSAMQDAQRALNPETTAIQEELSGIAREGFKGGLSDAERDQFLSDFRGNLGTNAGSPIGAFGTSRNMMLMNQQRQRESQNLGLSLAGRQQLAQPQAPNTTNFAGSLTPGQVMGFNQGIFGTQGNIFGTQAGMFNTAQTNATAERGQNISMINSGMGMLSTRDAKENIITNTIDSLDVLRQLEIVEYDYKEVDSKHHVGVIVEDSPEILVTEDGKHIDVVNVIGILLDANKKLLTRVETLEGGE